MYIYMYIAPPLEFACHFTAKAGCAARCCASSAGSDSSWLFERSMSLRFAAHEAPGLSGMRTHIVSSW